MLGNSHVRFLGGVSYPVRVVGKKKYHEKSLSNNLNNTGGNLMRKLDIFLVKKVQEAVNTTF